MSMTGTAVRAAHVSLLALLALCGQALAQAGEAVRISVCERAIERYAAMALMKRSPKMTAN